MTEAPRCVNASAHAATYGGTLRRYVRLPHDVVADNMGLSPVTSLWRKAARSAARLAARDGHAPRSLQENATRNASGRRVEPRESVMEQVRRYWIANFIWSTAADVLRDLYARDQYPDVILRMRREGRVA